MKPTNLYIIVFILLICQTVNAQLAKVNQINVPVCYHKTVHLIFPSDIKYFNSVSDVVAIDNPQNVPYILRIKANLLKCDKQTNVSVATADGKFYDFVVNYANDIYFTNLYLDTYKWTLPETIPVNDSVQTHLIFSDAIKYVDIGDNSIESSLAGGTLNILWIKANNKTLQETNVSVVTTRNKFYSYNVAFSDCPINSFYTDPNIKNEAEQVILPENQFTDGEKIRIMNKVNAFGRQVHALGEKKDGIMFSILNVFIHKNMLLFRCEIENLSSIPYDVEYMKFNIIDKKKEKLTASQEVEQQPIFLENYSGYVKPHDNSVFVIGFDKFTIPDDKFLQVELNEKNGGRHVLFLLKNKDIIEGQTF